MEKGKARECSKEHLRQCDTAEHITTAGELRPDCTDTHRQNLCGEIQWAKSHLCYGMSYIKQCLLLFLIPVVRSQMQFCTRTSCSQGACVRLLFQKERCGSLPCSGCLPVCRIPCFMKQTFNPSD